MFDSYSNNYVLTIEGCLTMDNNVNNEIEKILQYNNSVLPIHFRKSESALNSIIKQVQNDYATKQYDFRKFRDISLKQIGKIRHVKSFAPFSCEETLCIYLKRILDRKFHIKYPNRNEFIRSLFDMIAALHTMNNFTILKFDFETYFATVSSEYVYKKYIETSSLERFQIKMFEEFVTKTKYTYAGFNTSNILCEIIARDFDDKLKLNLKNLGLIFYRRYIDDGIIILNKKVEKKACITIIENVIKEVFFDPHIIVKNKCTTRLNNGKTKHISSYDLAINQINDDFDFLGYKFVISSTMSSNNLITSSFQFGITKKKIDRYNKRIDDIVKAYMSDKNIELLRHKIKAFTSRTVYRVPKYKVMIWKAKGFIANYQELRYRLDMLTPDTNDFLRNSVKNAFYNNNLSLPYFLLVKDDESIYSLYNNMFNFRTLLFVDKIGITKEKLDKMCNEIGVYDAKKGYDELVRTYLIAVKVGH